MSYFESLELAAAPKGNFPARGEFSWDCSLSTVLKEEIVRTGFSLRMINPRAVCL